MAATSSIVAAAMQLVAGLEGASGMPIAFLDRIEDPALFWARSAAILCDKTGDTFCDDQVQFMTANTEPLGNRFATRPLIAISVTPSSLCSATSNLSSASFTANRA